MLAACTASTLDVPQQGTSAPDAAGACERNFYPDEIVCYPTVDVGMRTRSERAGEQPGARAPNVKLVGFDQTNAAMTTVTAGGDGIAFADFFDPESRRLALLQIIITAWDPQSATLGQPTTNDVLTLAAQGVEMLVVLIDGTISDLRAWLDGDARPKPNVSIALNSQFMQLFEGPYYPESIFIDPRSMELLQIETGFDASYHTTQHWLAWVRSNPPRP